MAGFRSQIAFLSASFILKKFCLLGGGLLGSEPAGKERLLCKDANEVSQLLFVRFVCEARLWTTPRGEGEWHTLKFSQTRATRPSGGRDRLTFSESQNRKQEWCGFSAKGKSKPRCCQSKQEQRTMGKTKKVTSAVCNW